MLDQDQLKADQAALDQAQSADDAARAALQQRDIDLAAARIRLQTDTEAYDAEQTKIATNPVLGILDQMDKTVDDFASQVGVGVSDLFRKLIAQARSIVDPAPQATDPAPSVDPAGAPAATVADDSAGSVGTASDQGPGETTPGPDAQGTVVAAADGGAELTSDTDVTQASAA